MLSRTRIRTRTALSHAPEWREDYRGCHSCFVFVWVSIRIANCSLISLYLRWKHIVKADIVYNQSSANKNHFKRGNCNWLIFVVIFFAELLKDFHRFLHLLVLVQRYVIYWKKRNRCVVCNWHRWVICF